MKPLVLISETTCAVHLRKITALGWGRMFCQRRVSPSPGEPWGLDNGAFLCWRSGKPFDEARFNAKLSEARGAGGTPHIAIVPDIVAGGRDSLDFSIAWRERLVDSWPWYLAVQDGMTEADCRAALPMFAGVFLGGTDKFKLGAYRWCNLAHEAGKKFHYARAGNLTKLRHAIEIGADSLDSSLPLWTHKRFDRFAAHWKHEDTQNDLAFV